MKRHLLFFFVFLFSYTYAQNVENLELEPFADYLDDDYEDLSILNDTLTYSKSTKISKKRTFESDLKTKYSGKEFEYIDNLKKEEKSEKTNSEIDTASADLFIGFMKNVFPYLIGIIVVLIILKTFLNVESNFWKFGRQSKKIGETLLHEDHENIDETDFDKLLNNAIQNGNYRLATRYYYLSSLKKLSQKELITYDKDKTNTEYQFELKNKDLRMKFSYLAYIYDYVWYGEFPVDKSKFTLIESKYKSFIQVI